MVEAPDSFNYTSVLELKVDVTDWCGTFRSGHHVNISLYYCIILCLSYMRNCLLGFRIVGKYRHHKPMRSCLFLILSSLWSIEQTSECLVLKSVFFLPLFLMEESKRSPTFSRADWFQLGGINKCTKENQLCGRSKRKPNARCISKS